MTDLKHPLLKNLPIDERRKFWDFGLGVKERVPYQFIHQAFTAQSLSNPTFIIAVARQNQQ